MKYLGTVYMVSTGQPTIVDAQQVFTPGAPVKSKDLFAGRDQQLQRVLETITAPGRHPIIYGKRGVGKTSLANIISVFLKDVMAVRISCDGSDTFRSIWNRILNHATVSFKERAFGFSREESTRCTSLATMLGHNEEQVTPADIARVLSPIAMYTIFILDEFDKVLDSATRAQLADLVKILSDSHSPVTLILVGVAENITHLIGEHPSVERNLVQVELPTMTDEEIKHIATSGFAKLQLVADRRVLTELALLANGFPHYAHLLGLSAARVCIENEAKEVNWELFRTACDRAVEDAIEKYREAYTVATRTGKPSRYATILCACAFATHDERGVFRATDVVDAMGIEFDDHVTVPAVVPALGEFSSALRGGVLDKVPFRKRTHYRFADPMMRPFLRIKARSLTR